MKSGLGILIRAPEVLFLVPPKWQVKSEKLIHIKGSKIKVLSVNNNGSPDTPVEMHLGNNILDESEVNVQVWMKYL